MTELLLLRRVYELESESPNRTFARDHSFESWLKHEFPSGEYDDKERRANETH